MLVCEKGEWFDGRDDPTIQLLLDSAPEYMYSTALVGQFIDRAGHTSYHYLIQKLAVVYKLLIVNVTTVSID